MASCEGADDQRPPIKRNGDQRAAPPTSEFHLPVMRKPLGISEVAISDSRLRRDSQGDLADRSPASELLISLTAYSAMISETGDRPNQRGSLTDPQEFHTNVDHDGSQTKSIP